MPWKQSEGTMSEQNKLPSIDIDYIKKLSELLNETGLNEIEIEQGDSSIKVVRHNKTEGTVVQTAPAAVAAPAPTAEAQPAANGSANGIANAFKAPMVGTFYSAANPDSDPFITEGSRVKKGQTLCIIEAMKTFNQIESDRDGVVKKILASDAEPVEFGQPLFTIE